jgi:hypothetical protein
MINDGNAIFRRSSIYRQLSDVLKSKRKSYGSPVSSSSTLTFVWKCGSSKIDSPSNEDINIVNDSSDHRTIVTACLVKQKSISCDDVAFLSSNIDEQTIPANGLFLFNN